jgi:hypothetical protein
LKDSFNLDRFAPNIKDWFMYITSSMLTPEEMGMLQTNENDICISIIIPSHNNWAAGSKSTNLAHSIQKAIEQLNLSHPEAKDELEGKLQNLSNNLRLEKFPLGLGLFVSNKVALSVQFPFIVEEKVSISNHFELKDLLYMVNHSNTYYVLLLDEKQACLYSGQFNVLHKIQDSNFPIVYTDDYEYEKPSRMNSYSGRSNISSFEKDKSTLQKSRHLSFLKSVDELLDVYISKNDSQVIICGVKTLTASFLNHSKHDNKIIGVLHGNYSHLNEIELGQLVSPLLQAEQEEKMLDEISDLEEKKGEGLVEEGIFDVWTAITEGRGYILLVEKDYDVTVYYDKSYPMEILITPPKHSPGILENAVDRLIEMHLNKKGKVLFLNNDMLADHKQIALITRY